MTYELTCFFGLEEAWQENGPAPKRIGLTHLVPWYQNLQAMTISDFEKKKKLRGEVVGNGRGHVNPASLALQEACLGIASWTQKPQCEGI